jgi:putative aldouronate transport system substrate-binding protein
MRTKVSRMTLVIGIVACFAISAVFPAGQKEPAKEQSADKTPAAASGKTAEISFFAPNFDRIVKDGNIVVKEVEKRTNTKLSFSFVPAAEFRTKLNLLIAADTMADVTRMNGYDFFDYIPQGVFLELTQLLKQYGPGIVKTMPQKAWDLVKFQNKIYSIPSANYPGKYNFYIRQDWLDNLGLKKPSTTEELRAVLKAFTFNDPDKNGKKDTYGYTTESTFVTVPGTAFTAFFGAFGVMPNMYYEKDGKVYAPNITPQYKEAVEYIRSLYLDDKSIDPDIFIVQADQAKQNLVQGKIGGTTGWWSRIVEEFYDRMKMNQVTPEARWSMLDVLKGPRGETGMMSNGYVSWTSVVSAKSKVPVETIKLLEYLTTDEGATLANVGIKDTHYTVNPDGSYKERLPAGATGMNEKWLDVMSQWVMVIDLNQNLYKKNNPKYAEPIDAAKARPLYYNLFEGISTPESQKLSSALDKLTAEWFVRFVTGAEPMSNFDKFVAAWKEKGGTELFNSLLKEYNSRTGKNLVVGN